MTRPRLRRGTALALAGAAISACSSPDQSETRPGTSPPAALALPPSPAFPGWYADPEAAVFGHTFWIYPTFSAPYDQQLHFDAFSSTDLAHWTKHPNVLEAASIPWAKRAMWAPAVVERRGKYYFFFAANDIQNDQELGGIGVAIADSAGGPFRDYLGKPLVGRFHHGAQPIDQFVFRDADGTDYLIYGGWKHCNIARLKPDFTGFVPLTNAANTEPVNQHADGRAKGQSDANENDQLFKEITPEGYVEGPYMFIRGGKYYFMWSEGGWTGPDYSVAYAIGDSALGPFHRIGTVLKQDPAIATGAGHHSIIHDAPSDQYYIVYHRRPLGDTNPHHREVCIEPMNFDAAGLIMPVKLTKR